ncbi:MAG: WD40 repeat domain-containing protein [Pirellulales bacterium]|nr:WD40 repeat domain-containing protein [Pirellulales bacterium]
MPDSFDPYYQWLGIPPDEQPPDHYRLLGVRCFEDSADVIETAVDRQMVHLRTFQIGPRSALSEKLLSELTVARQCLLDPTRKAAYDEQLRRQRGEEPPRSDDSAELPDDPCFDALMAEAEAAGPVRLAPLRRQRASLRPWLVGGAVVLGLTLVMLALLSAVLWSLGRIRSTMDASSTANQPPTPPLLPVTGPPMTPARNPLREPPELTGSAEKSTEPPLLFTLTGHARPVCALVFSPDGRTLATGSKDKTVRLWDVDGGRMIWAKQEHTEEVNCVAFSPDGLTLASAGDDRTIRLWDAETGELRRTIIADDRGIRAIDFSPDGRRLVSAGHGRTVRLWDVDSGKRVRQWDAHDDSIMALAFSPDGRLLATGSLDRSIRLWDPTSGRLVQKLSGHDEAVRTLGFRFDGDRLVSGGEDGNWIEWDVKTGKPIKTKHDYGDRVLAVVFNPAGSVVAVGGRGKEHEIRVWDLASGEPAKILRGHAKAIGALAFSPNGRILASGGYDRVVKLWQGDPAAVEEPSGLPAPSAWK